MSHHHRYRRQLTETDEGRIIRAFRDMSWEQWRELIDWEALLEKLDLPTALDSSGDAILGELDHVEMMKGIT